MLKEFIFEKNNEKLTITKNNDKYVICSEFLGNIYSCPEVYISMEISEMSEMFLWFLNTLMEDDRF